MRTVIAPVLLIAAIVPVLAVAPRPATLSLEAEWERFGRGPRPESEQFDVLDDGLGDTLWTSAQGHRRLDEAIGDIAKTFGIERDTAADLVEATLLTRTFADLGYGTKPSTAPVLPAVSALWRAYRRAPAAGIVLQQAGWILFHVEHDPAVERQVLEELGRSADPAPLASRIAWVGLCDDETRRAAVAIALERRPDHPALLLAAAGLHEADPCVSASWARAALKAASAPGAIEEAFLATTRNRLLAALLALGLDREAVDAIATIPTREIDAAMGFGRSRAHGTIDGLEYEIQLVPVRSALASAAFLLDERDLAGRIAVMPQNLPPGEARDREAESERVELVRAAIDRLTTGAPPDPFDILDHAIAGEDNSFDVQLLASTFLFARLAREADYPEIASDLLATVRRIEASSDAAPARFGAQVAACRARAAQVSDDLGRQLRADSASALGGDPAAEGVAGRLAAEPLHVFVERPLPAGLAPWDPSTPELTRLSQSYGKWNVPGLEVVRVEKHESTVIAIGLSQDYDPAGEVSGGGYWIVRSSDGGKTWARALYTGLRPMQPYVVRSFSNLPLATGDRLSIEVEIRELDTDRITFPPVSRSFKRERKGLFLDVAWADLERDSDGDGLTDLAEERLLSDPHSPDTDKDGLSDAADPLPQVPFSGRPSARDLAMAAVLAAAQGESARPIFTGDPGGQGPASPGLDDMRTHEIALTSESTIFLVSDRGGFGGLSSGRRIVVLTPAESEQARNRFGAHFPATVRLYVDHSGKSALAIWSESWRGMTLRLRLKGGVWVSTQIGSWIT